MHAFSADISGYGLLFYGEAVPNVKRQGGMIADGGFSFAKCKYGWCCGLFRLLAGNKADSVYIISIGKWFSAR